MWGWGVDIGGRGMWKWCDWGCGGVGMVRWRCGGGNVEIGRTEICVRRCGIEKEMLLCEQQKCTVMVRRKAPTYRLELMAPVYRVVELELGVNLDVRGCGGWGIKGVLKEVWD